MIVNTSRTLIISRMATRQSPNTIMARAFSSNCEPVERIRSVFETYRREHFSDETPSRFQKHVIKAVQQGPNNNNDHRAGSSDSVQIENLNLILENIGRSDARLSSEDENLLLREAGVAMDDANSDRRIPVSTIMRQLF